MSLELKLVSEFYAFMREREMIRLRRLRGLPRESWTQDPIMRTYSFTNVKREHDRTTVGLRKIYDAHENEYRHQKFFNAAVYRYFGTVEMATAIGWIRDWTDEEKARVAQLADDRMLLGETVFTPAYIVPNCGSSEPKHVVVCEILTGIWHAMNDLLDETSWQTMCDKLCLLWGVGPFMAKEILLDFVLATGWHPADWETWTPCGPGGKRGASRVAYGRIENVTPDEALAIIREIYAARGDHWPAYFFTECAHLAVTHEPVTLDLTDIQFQLCEFDKYSRVAEGRKPKRNFRPTIDEITQAKP